MPSVYEVLRSRRRQHFVGRTAELGAVEAWFEGPARPTRVVAVSGPPGVGKTEFLQAIQDLAERYRARRLWVDARLAPPSPAGLVEHLESLRRNVWRAETWADPDGRPSLVLIDNYENLLHMDDWLRRLLLDWLPADEVLWIMAARGPALVSWTRDLAWGGRVSSVVLEPLSPAEVEEFLARRRARHLPASLVRRAHGLPLALQVLSEHAGEPEGMVSDLVGRQVTNAVWNAVSDTDVRRTLILLSTIHRADEELVEAVVGRAPVHFVDALTRVALVRIDPRGLSIHDAYRGWMRSDAKNRWPDEFARIQATAAQVLADRLHRRRDADSQFLAGSLMTLLREMLPQDPRYADLAAEFDAPPEPPEPEDRPYLHAFVDQWGPQPLPLRDLDRLHRLLDDWLDKFPKLVRVYRQTDRRPVAFFAPFLVSDATVDLIERHVGPLGDWLGEPADSLVRPFDRADTYFAGLVGIAARTDLPPTELVGLVMRDGLSLLAAGMRSLLMVGNPYLVQMLVGLGYRPRPPARPTPDDWQFYELDLRQRDFAAWLLEVTGGLLATQDHAFDIRDLRAALDHIQDIEALDRSNVGRAKGWDGRHLQEQLLRLLHHPSPPFPLIPEDQDLLARIYLPPTMPPERAAALYHVSRATLYRRLNRALAALKASLTRL